MVEDPDYLAKQLITYIGNKRALLGPIGDAIRIATTRLKAPKLRCWDAFAGSGVVSRFLKAHSSLVVSSDLEDYSTTAGRCYLTNRSDLQFRELENLVAEFNDDLIIESRSRGFFEELYAPRDDARIVAADRAFYTRENARRLDRYRSLIDTAPAKLRDLLLGPLLSEASVHANTAGVFKGFYKDRASGVGRFGGSGADSLKRILGEIRLEAPILSRFECDHEVHQGDANDLATKLGPFDLAYFDPPYNQHPYGSNYFMLNLLVNNRRPEAISRVSGIPTDWRRSGYNRRAEAAGLFEQLLNRTHARFLLVSFNDEGFIEPELMSNILRKQGAVQTFTLKYNAFRGSRSFENRSVHVQEMLFLVDRRRRGRIRV